ncbi:hypothetical protein B0T16DRAFT_457206 [Cercophora newfieldiana]|uniref:Uncharacterized protein n=1 Tax=Cercophora newfieldiana TaxID=92897 RepID=A0AA39YBY8_9PEZI|nr:hypothetical protein B0T16DRAFT_457206 [Cercophora newfieldiana]
MDAVTLQTQPNPDTPAVDDPLTYMTNMKARIDEIQVQRAKAYQEMKTHLYEYVANYKRSEHHLVDEHNACLAELSSRFPAEAATLEWAKPCAGVPDSDFFTTPGGFIIKYHPSSDPSPRPLVPPVPALVPIPMQPEAPVFRRVERPTFTQPYAPAPLVDAQST